MAGLKYLGDIQRPEDIITLRFLQQYFARFGGGGGSAAASTYAGDVGDGVNTIFIVQHDLGTTDIQVVIYEANGKGTEVDVDVEHTDGNHLTLRFQEAPTRAQFRLLAIRSGAVPEVGVTNFVQGPAGPAGARGAQGEQGIAGPPGRGSRIFFGDGPPLDGDPALQAAQPHDVYIDRSSGDYYELT